MPPKLNRAQQIQAWMQQHDAETKAQAERGRALMAALSAAAKRWNVPDPCIFITCGHCQEVAPAEAWTRRELGGELPPREFQCPNCNRSFRRRETPTLVHLDPIAARL
jgi:hypothetical protein